MSTRRDFLKHTGAVGVTIAISTPLVSGEAGNLRSGARSRAAAARITRIRGIVRREDTILRYPVSGDNWHMTWAADNRQYVSLCDGAGWANSSKEVHNSRMLAIDGEPRDARFEDLPQYPTLARPSQSDDQPRYYGFGTLAVDGHLYQFLSTLERPVCISELRDADPGKPFYFGGVKLIYSPDNGRTWHNQDGSTPVVWDRWDRRSRQTMLFFEEDQQAFSLISVLQMGRNYEHNRDGYVYVYSPNGKTEGTMNELVMFRVPKDRIRDRNAYEYFAGFQSGLAKWNSDIAARKPTCTFPRGWVNKFTHPFAWQPSVVYNPALGVYVMANWGMGSGNGVLPWADVTVDNLHWFAKPSYLGFWIAQDPWGPWTQIHEETVWKPGGDAGARAYEPQIAPKWIAADGKSFWLVWTDYQVLRDGSSLQQVIAARKGAADPCVWSEDDVRRYVEAVRTDMPYYSFNVQRVDFLIS